MKVFHIAHSLGAGGAEFLATHLALEQRRQGHDVSLYTLASVSSLAPDAQLAADRESALAAEGIRCAELGDSRRSPLKAGRALRATAPQPVPDVVHCHSAVALAASSVAWPSAPRVLTLHNSRLGFPARVLWLLSQLCREVVAVSSDVSDAYARFTNKPIRVIENGIPLPTVPPGRPDRRDRDVLVIAVGSLTPQKNYPRMLAAFDLAARELELAGYRAHLRIVGFGPDLMHIREEVSARGLAERLELLGARTDVPALLSSADVFLMASDYEGLPIALLEALAVGLPAVTTPFGSSREVLQGPLAEGVSASFDPDSLAERLVAVASNPQLRSELSVAASRRAHDYSIERCANAYLCLYERARGRGPRPPWR